MLAKRYSFHENMKMITRTAASPGTTSGTVIRRKTSYLPQPSIMAASSIDFGTSWMNTRMTQTTKGRPFSG